MREIFIGLEVDFYVTVIAEDCVKGLTVIVEDYVTLIAKFYLTVIVEVTAEMGLGKID